MKHRMPNTTYNGVESQYYLQMTTQYIIYMSIL